MKESNREKERGDIQDNRNKNKRLITTFRKTPFYDRNNKKTS